MPPVEPAPASSDPFEAIPLQGDALPGTGDREVHDRGSGMMELHRKDAAVVYAYVIDMRRYLNEGEFVTAASGTVTPVSDPEMAIRRMEYDVDGIALWLTGGQDELRYTVEIIARTNRRRTWRLRFAIITHGDAAPAEIIDITAEQIADAVGAGVGPILAFSPASLTFPATAVGVTAAPRTVDVLNVGSDTVSLQSISPSGAFSFTSNAQGRLAPGESFTLTVRFTPTRTGTVYGSIVIDGNTSVTLPLSGRGT